MDYTAKVASSVIFVTELDRSVDFYGALFGCKVALREAVGALLLAPGGFQIYLIAKGPREPHPTGGIGDQHLMWATDSVEALDHFEQQLKDLGCYAYTHSAGEVSFVEGRDPDGLRVTIAHPSPLQRPRSVLDARLYS
jgi:catechol 2,3-dioxygenase-like lactoylglutathione lyase family enzyme